MIAFARKYASKIAATNAALIVIALPLFAAFPCVAAPSSIDIQATLGFSNTFNPARWTPLTVTVSNHGSEVSAYLQVHTRAGDDFRDNLIDITHRRHIDLTRDSRKRVHFTVRLPNVAHPLLIRMVADGKELARKQIDLRSQFTANRLLVVLSRDANLDYLNDSDGVGLRVLYPHPELLPDQWQGYDAVSAVVLHGVSLEQLSARQYEALRKWIAQGGTLAVSGGVDYAWLRTPRMVELLPAPPVGMIEVTDAASVHKVFARPLEMTTPFHVNRLAASNAHISVSAAHIPLVAESSFGLGRVLYLTFDVTRAPFDRWPGMRQTWLDLLRINAASTQDSLVEATPSPVMELIELQSTDFPGHGTLLLFLALYLSVLLTGYRIAATARPMRWPLALATWAAPALFAPAAFWLFGPLLFDRGPSVAVVAVIEPLADSPYAHVQFDLGIHSNSNERGHRDTGAAMALSYAGLEPTLRAPTVPVQNPPGMNNSRTKKSSSWSFSEGAPRTVAPDDARRYTLHLLEGEDIIDFDLHMTVDNDSDQAANTPRVNIHNNSGRALYDAWLIAAGRAWSVGTIAAQGITRYRVAGSGFELDSRADEWWERLQRHPQANANNLLMLKTLIARKDSSKNFFRHTADPSTYPGRGNALLIASTRPVLLPVGSSATWQQAMRTLVLLTVPAAMLAKDESTVSDL